VNGFLCSYRLGDRRVRMLTQYQERFPLGDISRGRAAYRSITKIILFAQK
jgi:hypothetical protein